MVIIYHFLTVTVTSASAEIVFDKASGELCLIFSSDIQGCIHSQSLWYNISITDNNENKIFENNSIPESYCVTVTDVLSVPSCSPYLVSAHPYTIDNSIVFSSISQQITFGLFICVCIKVYTETIIIVLIHVIIIGTCSCLKENGMNCAILCD